MGKCRVKFCCIIPQIERNIEVFNGLLSALQKPHEQIRVIWCLNWNNTFTLGCNLDMSVVINGELVCCDPFKYSSFVVTSGNLATNLRNKIDVAFEEICEYIVKYFM